MLRLPRESEHPALDTNLKRPWDVGPDHLEKDSSQLTHRPEEANSYEGVSFSTVDTDTKTHSAEPGIFHEIHDKRSSFRNVQQVLTCAILIMLWFLAFSRI